MAKHNSLLQSPYNLNLLHQPGLVIESMYSKRSSTQKSGSRLDGKQMFSGSSFFLSPPRQRQKKRTSSIDSKGWGVAGERNGRRLLASQTMEGLYFWKPCIDFPRAHGGEIKRNGWMWVWRGGRSSEPPGGRFKAIFALFRQIGSVTITGVQDGGGTAYR